MQKNKSDLRPLDPYRIGDAVVYPDRGLVERDAKQYKLPAKLVKLLDTLVENNSRSVSREDLLTAVWGEFRGSDDLLNNSISKLRSALGTRYQGNPVIETVPKFGYRLCLEPQPLAGQKPGLLNGNRQTALVVALCALLLVSAVLIAKRSTIAITPAAYQPVVDLTKLIGAEYDPEYSFDGKSLVFSWVTSKQPNDLYHQDLATGHRVRLTEDAALEYFPGFSRDGRFLAYSRHLNDGICDIAVMELSTLEVISQTPCDGNLVLGLDWSPDGSYLISAWRANPKAPFHLVRINWRTQEVVDLIPINAEHSDTNPRFSNRGDTIAWRRSINNSSQIVLYDVGTASETVYPVDLQLSNLHWTKDDKALVLVAVEDYQRFQLYRLLLEDLSQPANSESLGLIDGTHVGLSVNPVSDALAFDQLTSRKHIIEVDLARGAVDYALESSFRDDYPQINQAGTKLTFRSNRSGRHGLWYFDRNLDQEPQFLFDVPDTIIGYSWLPGEAALVYATGGKLYVYDVDTQRHSLLTAAGDSEFLPSIRPDSQHIYYTKVVDGQHRGMRFNLTTRQREVVLDSPAFFLRESPDGKMIYFTQPDIPGLWRKPLAGGQVEMFVDTLDTNDWGSWTFFDQGILYLDRVGDELWIRGKDWQKKDTGIKIRLYKYPMEHRPNLTFDSSRQKVFLSINDDYTGNIKVFEPQN